MARDFDGANDRINMGSNASVDGFTQVTYIAWLRADLGASVFDLWATKGQGSGGTGSGGGLNTFENPNAYTFFRDWSTNDGEWISRVLTTGALSHVCWTYDGSSTSNDAVFYLDGVSQTIVESQTPSGTIVSDAAASLFLGEDSGGGSDFDGIVGFFCYHDSAFSAAEVNRHRWWGVAPGGPSTVKVWHPFWTTDLNNKGTATANGAATGTTVINTGCPKVERMWGSLMGVGR